MLVFVKDSNRGSSIELGDNLARELNRLFPATAISKKDPNLTSVKNKTIIFVKRIDLDLAKKLKDNNNKIYYLVVDQYPSNYLNLELNGVIYSNRKQSQDFLKFFNTSNSYVYYHHYSPSLEKVLPKTKNIGYFVNSNNISPLLKTINCIDIFTEFIVYKEFISEYRFHIEHREFNSLDFFYKPCIKLSTAAFCESVFICSESNSYLELLPKDYPYLLSSEFNKEILEEIINSYLSTKYNYALDVMLSLKDNLNIKKTSIGLLKFLTEC